MGAKTKTLAVDFDGVINGYSHWKGKGIFEEPVPGAREYLRRLADEGWVIIVYTTRVEETAVKEYLIEHRIPFNYINFNPENIEQECGSKKPLATVYLDDRGVRFNGDWALAYDEIINCKVWWRRD